MMRRRTGSGNPDSGQSRPPIAIRRALEEGWAAFRGAALPLTLFSLLLGGINLLCQLAIRWSAELLLNPFGQPDPLALVLQLLAWLGYLVSNLWLLVGLLRGADSALRGERPQLIALLATKPTDLLRAGGTLGLVLLVLALVLRLAQASAWMLALLQPLLVGLPLLAGLAAVVYLVTDQLFSLPISVLVPMNPLQAFRSSRAAIDPHWIQALGLTFLLGLLVLGGFLLLVVGLAGALPLAACTLVAAFRQVFTVPVLNPSRQPQPRQSPRNPA
jgi:hypothetical protein